MSFIKKAYNSIQFKGISTKVTVFKTDICQKINDKILQVSKIKVVKCESCQKLKQSKVANI